MMQFHRLCSYGCRDDGVISPIVVALSSSYTRKGQEIVMFVSHPANSGMTHVYGMCLARC